MSITEYETECPKLKEEMDIIVSKYAPEYILEALSDSFDKSSSRIDIKVANLLKMVWLDILEMIPGYQQNPRVEILRESLAGKEE